MSLVARRPMPSRVAPRRARGLVVRALVACIALAVSPHEASAQTSATVPIITPGYEALFAEMLGRDVLLPGPCRWAGASVERTQVASRYDCAGGPVALTLLAVGAAPPDAVRTRAFALRVASGTPPPGLLEAIAVRVRARESAFHWQSREAPASPSSPRHTRVALAALLAALVAVIAARLARPRRATAVTAVPPALAHAARSALFPWATSVVAVAGFHAAARALGAAVDRYATRPAPALAALYVVAVFAALAVATFAARLLALAPRRRAAVSALLVGAAYLAWAMVWRPASSTDARFGSLAVPAPDRTVSDTTRHRAHALYRTNHLGFRTPDFAIQRTPGVARIALVGDSFVFGIGVADGDTLSARLSEQLAQRSPGHPREVLNLGIPGDNLASHVDAYAAAVARLRPDVVVLCLNIPNDLSRWDYQVARREAARLTPFHFAQFALGAAATEALWSYARLDGAVTADGLAWLDHQVDRLAHLRADATASPALVVFAYGPLDDGVERRVRRIPGVTLVDDPQGGDPSHFIPGDGHPNATGNRFFAERLADGLLALPVVRTEP